MDRARILLEKQIAVMTPEELRRFDHLLFNPRVADVWQATVPHVLDPWQVEILAPIIEEVATEEGIFVAIHAPPGFGKSEGVTERGIAYTLGCDPDESLWLMSNNKDHAAEFGVTISHLLGDDDFLSLFPRGEWARVQKDTSGARFSTLSRQRMFTNHPSFVAGGLQRGATVGKHPRKMFVDDPYADMEEALSIATNERVWRKFRKGLLPRVKPWTSMLWMYHAYQPDDAMGRLKAMEPRLREIFRKVRFVRLPALADENRDGDDPTRCCRLDERTLWESGIRRYWRGYGEALSPRRTVAEMKGIERDDPVMFAGMYQGRPVPEGGDFIQREWLKTVRRGPGAKLYARFFDLSVGRKQTSDHTAGAFGCVGEDAELGVPPQTLYVVDMLRIREQWGTAIDTILMTIRADKAWCDSIGASYWVGVEEVYWMDAMIQDLVKALGNEVQFQPVPAWTKGDKKTAASGWVARARYNRFRMVAGPWNQAFVDEAVVFTGRDTDKHDDQIDGVSGLYALLWWVLGRPMEDENNERQEDGEFEDAGDDEREYWAG